MWRAAVLLFLALILCACGIKQQPDNPKYLGTWVLQSDPNQLLVFKKDGTVKYIIDVSGQYLEATGIFVGTDDTLITHYRDIQTRNYPAEYEAATRDNILGRDRQFAVEWPSPDRQHITDAETGFVETWQRL